MKITEIRNSLLEYYKGHQRDLPWRRDPTPYHVWISEIMLQQTRVETVIDYYNRFLRAFPDVQSLAGATIDEVNKLWEGLGYYRRAFHLRETAKIVLEEYQGHLPGEKTQLQKLPGIGPYTAGAIASIAFGKRQGAVDGNIFRVLSRVYLLPGLLTKTSVRRETELLVENLMPEERPGDLIQALMDLGSSVCIGNGVPLCHICPLSKHCEAFKKGLQQEFPEKSQKAKVLEEEKTVLLLFLRNKVFIEKRQATGLLRGLWQYPLLEGTLNKIQVEEFLKEKGYQVHRLQEFYPSIHLFSHRKWNMKSYVIDVEVQTVKESAQGLWVDKKELVKDFSIPSAFKIYTSAIKKADKLSALELLEK